MEVTSSGKRVFAMVGSVLVLAFGVSTSAEAAPPDVSQDLLTPGTLLVGSDIPYPPFEFGVAPKYDGFDIDLVNAMAEKLELQVRIKDVSFETIFTDVRRRKFDIAASATAITPLRKRFVTFTAPNYDAQQSLVVRKGSSIRSTRNLRRVTVGVQDGTSGSDFAKGKIRTKKVVGYPNGHASIRALKRGEVGAVIIDQPVAQNALDRGVAGIKIVRNFSVGEKYAYAVSKKSSDLLRGINWAFAELKADGSFKIIYNKWFGIDPPASLRN